MDQNILTEKVLEYRSKHKAFEYSIESRSPSMIFRFFDGPPFTSGDPHYGHLLQSVVKDIVPRWMTMRGYRVNRKWGWDCHGIPAENYVNKKLGITSRKEVEEDIGIGKYVESCRSMVNEVNDNRQWTVDHLGRWCDMENAYFTMNNDFMESVIHVFADLYHKNLIYKGFKVLGYSRALGTALSNSEIAEGYENRQDPAVTVRLQLVKGKIQPQEGVWTDDNFREVSLSVIRHDEKILMVYDTKYGKWFIPGGKVDLGETIQEALSREIYEEIGVKTISSTLVGKIKVPHHGKLRRLNYFETTIEGEVKNMEPHKQGAIAWVSYLDSDNSLGYAIKIEPMGEKGSTIIDDVDQIENDFGDLQVVKSKKYQYDGMDEAPISLLAWTTTPWTLPSNMFGAVNKDILYVLIYDLLSIEYVVIAKSLIGKYFKQESDYAIIFEISGDELVGLRYKPLFDYYYRNKDIKDEYKEVVHQILSAEFVTEDSGTGIAHEAPAFGEDDYTLVCSILPREHAKDWLFDPVNEHGEFTNLVPDRDGINVIEANKDIIRALKEHGLLYKLETIDHSYPHCPRTKTPLIYKAIESWFLKEEQLKELTLPSTQGQTFIPDSIKKRFYNGLESAPDWNISRTRFWGCPLPVWENPMDPEERIVVSSIEEIYQLNKSFGQIVKTETDGTIEYTFSNTGKQVDLHRPYIDDILLKNPKTGHDLKRIPEVLDCRFESGSMPYGQNHWMKNLEQADCEMPIADFIAEGLDQTRGWFRALHVIGNAYLGTRVFDNVLVTGMILAEDGKKMSKSLNNYPDPSLLLKQYGADPLRLYLLGSPVVRAEPLRFVEQGVQQMLKDFVIPLNNVWNFLKTYAEVDNRKDDGTEIFFMRHAHCPKSQEIPRTKRTPLTQDGFDSLQTKEFRESIVRINPDVILTTDFLRTEQTAYGIKEIMEKYGNKSVEIIIQPTQSTNSVLLEQLEIENFELIKERYAGKTILFVSHRQRFEYIWNYLMDNSLFNGLETQEDDLDSPIDYLEIVPLPSATISNELDKWIYAELHRLIKQLDIDLQQYQLEAGTKSLLSFVDKLTNRYVRRSRRRFWSSGMDQDKKSAYATLFHVLKTYLQCSAPFTPFITEHIWQEMNLHGSIHWTYWPLMSDKYIDETLIDEVETVRKIIKGALTIRAKQQIKVKQPLQELKFTL